MGTGMCNTLNGVGVLKSRIQEDVLDMCRWSDEHFF